MGRLQVLTRAAIAIGFLAALSSVVFFFDAQPLPQPPLYGGAAHPWLAALAMAGILGGAVGLPSVWARSAGWSAAAAFLIFELGIAVSRMPSASPVGLPLAFRPWTRALEMAAVFGVITFLGFALSILSSRMKSADSAG